MGTQPPENRSGLQGLGGSDLRRRYAETCFRQKQFFVCVALLALICLVSNLTVNLIQDRTAMTLLHTLCYVAMIPIFRRIGKIVMQCAEQTNE